ncbi:hypothetical protein [Microbacterium wangchenii]|uniref:hypothetical protein n=1 Tax=Microbacterium wangchenii TaxID=2541726 RepID=UPI001650061E|nr:hypothetical protein [Microbacterium wangchenii]
MSRSPRISATTPASRGGFAAPGTRLSSGRAGILPPRMSATGGVLLFRTSHRAPPP